MRAVQEKSSVAVDVLVRASLGLVLLASFLTPLHAATFTVTKTADTNDGVCNADCSLREAIGAANANGVPDLIAFNIPLADPGFNAGTGVFTIAPGSTLSISDANTTIDGTTQTASVGNTNPVVLGTGGTVGVDGLGLSQINGPEIEIRGQSAINYGLQVTADNTIIRGLAIYGYGSSLLHADIFVNDGVNGGTFEYNVLGTRAHTFSDPGVGARSWSTFSSDGADNWQLQHNLIGFTETRGAFALNASRNWTVSDNEFRDNALEDIGGDNLAIDTDATPGTVSGNLIVGAASQGLVISNTAGNVIVNNTFEENGVGHASAAPTQTGALTLRNTADNVTIDRNVFAANYGAGLLVNYQSGGNLITRNSFFDNGTISSRNGSPPTNQIGIDLLDSGNDQDRGDAPFYDLNDDGDGDPGGNDLFNFAVIRTAQIIGTSLVVSGYAAGGATVEFFISDGDPSNFGEGRTFLFSAIEGSGADSDGGSGSYGPGAVNGVVQGDESPVPEYRFTVPLVALPVPVTAADELVATATLAGRTSEFGARAPVDVGTIAGTIFVDIAGDGLADGPIGPLPNPFESGTRIELWLDGGDGIPDGGDDVYQTFTTSSGADGSYQFAGLRNGTYWITVDSGGVNRGPYNGGYSGADAWAEQTYGPAGAATFDGAVWSFAPAAGAVYGGAEWDVSDNFPPTNSLPTAEHIGRVTVSDNDTANVDFGFSFNVVTTTRGGAGGSDPGTPPGQRTVQGSLRQFLTNANAATGANAMRFVPAAPTNGSDGGGNDWWRIDVSALLPVISDTATTVDGAAYSTADGLTPVDSNDANIGAGETVGVDGLFTTPVLDPELEIEVSGVDYGLQIDNASSVVIRNISIWKSNENDLRLGDGAGAGFSGTLIEQNVIGTPPHRFDSSFQPTGNDLIDALGDVDSGTLQNNLIGFADGGGFSPDQDATPWLVFQNEIRGIGRAAGWGPNQDAIGDGAPGIIVRGNLLADNAGGGVESNLMPGGFTIEQNTLRNNGTASPETFSIRLMGNTGNLVTKNIFESGNGPAIIVVSDRVAPPYAGSEANLITQNSFLIDSAGIAIDLLDAGSPDNEHDNGDGITLNDGTTVANDGNDGLDFPVIDGVALGASLTVSGFSRPGVSIEFYKAVGAVNDQNTGGTAHGEGVAYLFTATEGTAADTDATTGSYASPDYGSDPAANRFRFTVAAPPGLAVGDAVSAIAIDGSGNTSEFGPNFVAAAGGSIAGTVFDDTAGDGLAGAQAIGDAANPVLGGVAVLIYDDTGATAGQPDAGDASIASTTTAGDGTYSFAGLANGTYWIAVDSKTLSADNNTWGEQTYGPAGGWCADGAGGTTEGLAAAGVCYGGRRADPVPANPSSDDLTAWHSGAEHLAEITVAGGAVTGVDFGFSFNVVTTTRGGDATDDDGANPRTVQGSLRQFIQNANAIAGASMRFVPAEPLNASSGGHSWWQIQVSAAQPLIAGAATVIDGSAYDFSDGTTLLDTNTAAIGAGAAVGVSGAFNTPQLDPELELRGDGVVNVGLEIRPTADGSAVRNLAINAFSINAVRLIGTLPDDLDNVTLENTVIGTSPASFSDDPLLSTGRALFARDLSNATIRNNLAGWLDWGFQVQFDTFDSLIESNEIRGCAVHGLYVAGVAGTGQQPARITIRGNLVEENGSNAINTSQALNQLTIADNTLRTSGGAGAVIYGVQNTITSNIVTDNTGAGLVVTGDQSPAHPAVSQTRISQNRFGNNGQLAIDLVANGIGADGITLNDDTDADTGGANELHNFPVIESAVIAAGNLTVTGFARPGADLEFYEAAGAADDLNGGGTAHGEGIAYLFTATEGSGADSDATTGSYGSPDYGADTAAERFRFVLPAPAGLSIGEQLSATSTDTTDDTSEFGPNMVVTAPYNIIKRAFLPDGTPVVDGTALPVGVEFKFMLYINNRDGATNDASIRDVLDPLFAYQSGSLQVDNSVAGCAAAACTPAEEAAIFAAAIATAVLSDAVDADVASFDGTDTVDAGNRYVANGQLDIAADSVLALVFSAKIQ